MKVYISVDMEGITGINNNKFLMDDQPEYDRGRKLMTEDLNAAIEGAVEAGATEILVNDAHGCMRNILIEDLHEKADLVTGYPKKNLMMAGLDESYDAAMLVGYHSRAGSGGILDHTIGELFKDVRLNGKSYGETGLSAAMAGFYDVPVVMVSGDDVVRDEAVDVLPDVEFAMTKECYSPIAAKMLNPKRSKALIKEKAKAGLLRREDIKPFALGENIDVEVSMNASEQAFIVELIPCAKRISTSTVAFSAENIEEVNNFLCTVMNACCVLSLGMF
jgi:D-amino peptidase